MINFAITKYSDEVFIESLQIAQNLLKQREMLDEVAPVFNT